MLHKFHVGKSADNKWFVIKMTDDKELPNVQFSLWTNIAFLNCWILEEAEVSEDGQDSVLPKFEQTTLFVVNCQHRPTLLAQECCKHVVWHIYVYF